MYVSYVLRDKVRATGALMGTYSTVSNENMSPRTSHSLGTVCDDIEYIGIVPRKNGDRVHICAQGLSFDRRRNLNSL